MGWCGLILFLALLIALAAGCSSGKTGSSIEETISATTESKPATEEPTSSESTSSDNGSSESANSGAEISGEEQTRGRRIVGEPAASSASDTESGGTVSENEQPATAGTDAAQAGSEPTTTESSEVSAESQQSAANEYDEASAQSGQYESGYGGAQAEAGRSSVASEGEPFVESPTASGGSGYGANALLDVRSGAHAGYERVVLDLGSSGELAGTVPRWTLSSPTGSGLLRVSLPSVATTSVSGGSLGSGLVESFYVVRAPGGGMFVDIFSGSAFVYRVVQLQDPARIAIDFKPTSASLSVPLPAVGGNTVLLEPRRGEGISSSLTVSGYSRNFEASNTIILTDVSGEVVLRETVLGNDWTSTWGYFEATLEIPPSFSGQGTLKVGAQSARDGSFTGVEIPVG